MLNGQIRLNDKYFQKIENDLDILDSYIDIWENGKLNPISGKIEMRGLFNIYPKLKLIIDKYFNWLNGE